MAQTLEEIKQKASGLSKEDQQRLTNAVGGYLKKNNTTNINNSVNPNTLTPALGYEENQSLIPGVNATQNKTTPIIPPTKNSTNTNLNTTTGNTNNNLITNNNLTTNTNGTDKFQNNEFGEYTPAVNDYFRTIDTSYQNSQKRLDENEKAELNALKDEQILGRGELERQSSYISNYDTINNLYNSVFRESRELMDDTGYISDRDADEIARRYGVSIEEVKNPRLLSERFEYTDEGKRILGLDQIPKTIEEIELQATRNIEDATRKNEEYRNSIIKQKNDLSQNAEAQVRAMEHIGATSGVINSSGYISAINNLEAGALTSLDRLQQGINSADRETAIYSSRIQDDTARAVNELNTQLLDKTKQIGYNTLIDLQKLQAKYGYDSNEYSIRLNEILDKYGQANIDLVNSAVSAQKEVLDYVDGIINLNQRVEEVNNLKRVERYNAYRENDGELLINTSLRDIFEQAYYGDLSAEQANNLIKTMQTSIQNTLGSVASITNGELQEIDQLLNDGYTPQQIVSYMQEKYEKFVPNSSEQSLIKMGDTNIYDPNTQTWITAPKNNTGGGINNIGGYSDLTNVVNQRKTDSNVGKWTNNPGNIMGDSQTQKDYAIKLGAIGFYNSANGRTYAVFPDEDTGTNALISDLQTKLNGGSSWATANTTISQFAKGWTNGPNGADNPGATSNMINYLSSQGLNVNQNTKIGDIPLNLLANAIKSNEGTLGVGGQDYTGLFNKNNTNINYTPSQIAIMDKYLSSPTKANREELEYLGLNVGDADLYRLSQEPEEGMGILGVPIPYERGIKNIVPTTLMNSEVELEQLNNTIKAMYKQGLSQEEAGLTYMGFDVDSIKKQGDLNLAIKLIDAVRSSGANEDKLSSVIGGLNTSLKRGQTGNAVKQAEQAVQTIMKSELGEEYISDTRMAFSKQVLDKLLNLIDRNQDKIGPISGRFSDLKKNFVDDEDYQALITLLEGDLAESRRHFAGTAVTESELRAIKNFIGLNTNMTIGNLKTALETNFDRELTGYNTQREQYGLATMPREYIGSSWNTRANLYLDDGISNEPLSRTASALNTYLGTGNQVNNINTGVGTTSQGITASNGNTYNLIIR